ncbi:MAG: hypothetical protein AAF570_28975, partial [Bacteroidota bacterium]
MRIGEDGKVGIGTNSPAHELDVAGTVNAADVMINGQSLSNAVSGGNGNFSTLHVTDMLEVGPNSVHIGNFTNSQMHAYENNIWTPISQGSTGFTGPHLYIQDGIPQGTTRAHHVIMAANGAIGNVAIGTLNPVAKFHINNEYNQDAVMIERDMAGTNWENTQAKFGISANAPNRSGLRFQISDNDGSSFSDVLYLDDAGKVGIGTTEPDYKLDVCGDVRAEEIKVQAGWCDYVFEPDYDLRPLEEVDAYIRAHKHLPNIPPASEVESEGLELGDMQTRMMEKIEELTLYVIELKKEIE